MPDDDNKWTAHRGSQGDNWRWQGDTPPEPDAFTDAPLYPPPSEKPQRRLPALNPGPAMAGASAFLAAAGATAARPFRGLWARAAAREAAGEKRDFTIFAFVLSMFTFLASVILLVLLITSVTDDDSNGAVPPTDEPTTTEEPTDEPTDAPRASPSPTRRPSPTLDVLVPPGPEGDLSLGLWANQLDAWWFGELPEDAAIYHPGDEVPWLARWAAVPGAAYTVSITYECRDGDVPLIDLLTGVEYAHDAIFLAEWGPGSTRPDAAVPVPDTADSQVDDSAPGLLYLYGGKFTLLPQGPLPAGPCTGERTITVPVEASGQTLLLMGSAWLAHPDDHDGDSAAEATSPFGLAVRVSGLGAAGADLSPDTLAP